MVAGGNVDAIVAAMYDGSGRTSGIGEVVGGKTAAPAAEVELRPESEPGLDPEGEMG